MLYLLCSQDSYANDKVKLPQLFASSFLIKFIALYASTQNKVVLVNNEFKITAFLLYSLQLHVFTHSNCCFSFFTLHYYSPFFYFSEPPDDDR